MLILLVLLVCEEFPVQILPQHQGPCQEEEDSGDNFGNHAIVHDCRIPVRSGGFRCGGFNGEGRHGIRYKGFCQLFPVGFLLLVYDNGEKKRSILLLRDSDFPGTGR